MPHRISRWNQASGDRCPPSRSSLCHLSCSPTAASYRDLPRPKHTGPAIPCSTMAAKIPGTEDPSTSGPGRVGSNNTIKLIFPGIASTPIHAIRGEHEFIDDVFHEPHSEKPVRKRTFSISTNETGTISPMAMIRGGRASVSTSASIQSNSISPEAAITPQNG